MHTVALFLCVWVIASPFLGCIIGKMLARAAEEQTRPLDSK